MKRRRFPLYLVFVLLPTATAQAKDTLFTDPRDGERYSVIAVAGMNWFGQNLNHALAGSVCFDDKVENCARYGRLYRWELAVQACPSGWHLSTEDEWRRLETHLGMRPEELGQTKGRGPGVGDRLKVGGSSGLDIAFSGWRDPEGGFHEGNGNDRAAALWTANEADPATAWHRDLSSARSVVWRSVVDKPYSLSVRCVRDEMSARPSP